MLIAGEPSGDLLASELVLALRARYPDARFFGAGGPRMAAAGVEPAFDMTEHAVLGLTDVIKKYFQFRALFHRLLALAIERKPDAVIGVDYGGFNLRFGHAAKRHIRRAGGTDWNPKIVQFVSPQVWASRPGRAKVLEADYDLLLSIFPFEKQWYAQHAPKLRVEFVGHPMVDRMKRAEGREKREGQRAEIGGHGPEIVVLPGSRKSELKKHLPIMLNALRLIREKLPAARAKMVLPTEELRQLALSHQIETEIQVGNLHEALAQADLAITKTGTITMECAFFGLPAVTIYKKWLLGLALALGIITVKSLTMPNLMAGEEVYPEFLQSAATPENIARAALELLQNESRRQKIKEQLAKIVVSLGEPGASQRAAVAIEGLFN